MIILVLQGPNLDAIGNISAYAGERVTLDKINSALRKSCRGKDVQLKILQTAKASKALKFIRRSGKKADGILFAPMAWSQYEYSLKEALNIVQIPVVEILLDPPYFASTESSIFSEACVKTETGHPDTVFTIALKSILDHLSA
ncbi:MAG: type II 3-dehydroquinate dehydratase [Candidatus Marinimicrobia bacterium]|jgi:3-dehydroquinate dehydratase-2|nr:type II 3-dehydroquinate dehydratase [Candidatus Neomarinimicrobiota bacterium]MDP7071731.1 type II 3-dehydroquinate dehydratase [Candidatus Neomarinimicrobiota bacterium]